MFCSVSAPWAPSRVDMCALQIFIIIIIIIIIIMKVKYAQVHYFKQLFLKR